MASFCSSNYSHLPISVRWPPYHSFFYSSSMVDRILLTSSLSNSIHYLSSIWSKLIATPVLPYLPVLPIRCQNVSLCLASNRITKSNLISIPLDSKSEAIIIFVLFIWFIILNRAAWDKDPWIKTCSKLFRFWEICYKNDFFSTNIKHFWYWSSSRSSLNFLILLSKIESFS